MVCLRESRVSDLDIVDNFASASLSSAINDLITSAPASLYQHHISRKHYIVARIALPSTWRLRSQMCECLCPKHVVIISPISILISGSDVI